MCVVIYVKNVDWNRIGYLNDQYINFLILSQVVCAPYKANAVRAFGRSLIAPIKILKDCIQIMKCELVSFKIQFRHGVNNLCELVVQQSVRVIVIQEIHVPVCLRTFMDAQYRDQICISQFPDRNLNWNLQWCLTVPHGAPIVGTPAGTPAVVINVKGKILLLVSQFLHNPDYFGVLTSKTSHNKYRLFTTTYWTIT